ncbi:MAG: SUMF1/EgtB/PvdO family nonheme iron enzyme, partial [Desulforhopalus sp.]
MPEEAREFAGITVTAGMGFSLGSTVYSLSKYPEITVSAPGYKVATETLGPARLGKVFLLELFELPGRLIIELTNEDNDLSKTTWRLNDREVALSGNLDLELDAGNYSIDADNKFYQVYGMKVEVARDEETRILVGLQPISGMVNISSQPTGARVFLGEKAVGITPVQLGLKGGRHSLRVSAAHYFDTVEEFEITRESSEVNRNYRLRRKKAKVTARLKPETGTLLVNGRMVKSPFVLDSMVEHRLTYIKEGYYPQTQTLVLKADEEREISFNLKAEVGLVQIESAPPANVWIGKKHLGLSPVVTSLSAVNHEISFKKPGYRTVVKSIKPKGGSVQKVSAQLLTEYQARLQEAPREFTNQAGIKMKLFLIKGSFTMGAPRSEKGQRANEFQREISLTKPFYASIYEITNGQFKKFNPKKNAENDDTPVTSVSWQEAAMYCNWLSVKEGLLPFYKVEGKRVTGFNSETDGYRLLSEAEWEWLARKAGKITQTIFSWGNGTTIPPGAANVADESGKGQARFFVPYYNDGYSGVAPVGSFNSEPSGLYDLAGNVSEWVHDVYSIVVPTHHSAVSNPLGQESGQTHVVKGANWRSGTITTLRPAFREGLTGVRDDVGFRIGRYLYGGNNE